MTTPSKLVLPGETLLRDLFERGEHRRIGFSANADIARYAKAGIREHLKVQTGLDGRGEDMGERVIAATHIGYEVGDADARVHCEPTPAGVRQALAVAQRLDTAAEVEQYRIGVDSPEALSASLRSFAQGHVDAAVQKLVMVDPSLREEYERTLVEARSLADQWETSGSEQILIEIERRLADAESIASAYAQEHMVSEEMSDLDIRLFARRRIRVVAFEAEARRIGQVRLQHAVRARAVDPESAGERLAPDEALNKARGSFRIRAQSRRVSERTANDTAESLLRAERRASERAGNAPIEFGTLIALDSERRARAFPDRGSPSRARAHEGQLRRRA